MNENPAGTPNPLNPATPSEPAMPGGPTIPSEPVTPVSSAPESIQISPEQGESIQVESMQAETVIGESPLDQPMTEQPVAEQQTVEVVKPLKKSRTPMIVVAIVLILIAIGAGVAAIMVWNPFASHDAVPAAISKLFSAGAPQNVRMTGTITTYDNSDYAISPSVAIDFSSDINNATAENVAAMNIKVTLAGDNTFTFDANEIHTTGGDLYLKLSNISSALTNYADSKGGCADDGFGTLDETECVSVIPEETDCDGDESGLTDCAVVEPVETNCIGDESGMTNCIYQEPEPSVLDFMDVFDVIDDEWIKIPESQFSSLASMTSGSDAMASCLISAAGKLGEYGDNFATLYKENPFVEYSTTDISISAKKDTLYHLYFNSTKLTAFVNSIGNSGFANELMACAGNFAVNEDITEDDISAVLAKIPKIYVEIDNKDNFTRLYMTMESEDGLSGAVADISFEYPTSAVTIEEPDDYIELGDFLAQLLSEFYDADVLD